MSFNVRISCTFAALKLDSSIEWVMAQEDATAGWSKTAVSIQWNSQGFSEFNLHINVTDKDDVPLCVWRERLGWRKHVVKN